MAVAIGVTNAAATLEIAVRDTESAVLPRANNTNIFETFPPGQQAIKIIPRAIDGTGSINTQRAIVSIGKPINCVVTPIKKARGAARKKTKLDGFRLRATENIIIAKENAKPISDA